MKKGFTLVELVIVIIIVGILSIVAVPIYRGYTDRAKETEGKALLGSILTSEKVYLAEYDYFLPVTSTDKSDRLSIDTSGNKYFKSFQVEAVATNTGTDAVFTAYAYPDASLTAGSTHLKNITMVAKANGGSTIMGGVSGENIGSN
ncbi:prepilin-type N-terminal cleavage/methylation domain-containing protein [Candidatus Ruminimicrobium bovinum]|uniref:prepilin-type N-terminal cleavage/methylation domain-containing protein n=1 Tax=Candidatus Ruminimicrobium bovinum TaxID=3242779 RepID=UPI0039B884DC